jgi:hypothetical protein
MTRLGEMSEEYDQPLPRTANRAAQTRAKPAVLDLQRDEARAGCNPRQPGPPLLAMSAGQVAFAQKQTGVLKMSYFERPASASLHEEATASPTGQSRASSPVSMARLRRVKSGHVFS